MLKDFKGFKKIGGDAKHTVMRHDKGHEIKIAHSALSPKMRAKLAELPHADPKHADKTAPIKMSEGGEVYEYDKYGNIVGKKKQEKSAEEFGAGVKKGFYDNTGKPKDSYAKGGQIPGGAGSPYMDKDVAKGIAKGASQSGADMERWAENLKKAFAEQGKKKMFGGGRVPEPKEEEKKKEEKAPVSQETWDKWRKGFKQHLADGGKVIKAADGVLVPESEEAPAQAPVSAAAPASQPIIINIPSPQQAAQQFLPPQQPEAAPQAAMAAPEQQAPQMQQPAAPQAPMEAPQQAPDPYGVNQQVSTALGGMNMERKGILGEAAAQSEGAKAEAEIARNQADTAAIDRAKFLTDYGALETEYKNALDDYKTGQIKPDDWWESKDTGGKVMTVIGLMLGGFAGGALGTENPALAMLNKQIDRNIEAQKANLNHKHNLLSVYKEKFGNLRDAEQMVRILTEGYYASLMQEQVAKSKDPMVKARGQQVLGAFDQKRAAEFQQLVQRQTMLRGLKEGTAAPERMIPTLVPQHLQKDALNEVGILRGIDQGVKDVNKLYDSATLIGVKGKMPFSDDKVRLGSLNSGIIGILRASMKGQGALSDQEVADSVTPNLPDALDTVDQVNIKRAELLRFIASKRASAAPTLMAYEVPTTFAPKREFQHLPPKLK